MRRRTKRKLKKCAFYTFLFLVFATFIGLAFPYKDTVVQFVNSYLAPYKEITLGEINEYYRNYDFDFVQNINYFIPDNNQDLLNIYYTVINSGQDEFTFYCPKEYEHCLKDVKKIANDQTTLSDINNYVHPFNSFSHIETEYDNLGKVTIKISHVYDSNTITLIKNKVDELFTELTSEEYSLYKNIEIIHDYIINNSKYDTVKSEEKESGYHSDTAYGPLFEGYGICSGYTDLMELFLERLKVKSFKVSSSKHVWNAVYYNGEWLNLDLTWDDPVANDGHDYLEHNYFLINTNKLIELDITEHIFNEEHYYELKRA